MDLLEDDGWHGDGVEDLLVDTVAVGHEVLEAFLDGLTAEEHAACRTAVGELRLVAGEGRFVLSPFRWRVNPRTCP